MRAVKKRHVKRPKVIEHIVLATLTLFTFMPLWYVICNAFKKKEYILRNPFFITPDTFTIDSIVRAFKVMDYPSTLLNNVIILAISSLMLIIFGSMAGFAIAITNSKILNKYYVLLIMIMTLPFQLAMVPLVSMMRKMNLINNYFGISIVFAAFSLPFAIFLYTGYMKSLPKELSEAAIIDGCNTFEAYYYIYMPLLKAVTGTIIILKGVFIWNDLLIPIVTITKSSMTPLSLKLYSFASVRLTSWDLVFAGTLLVSLPVTILFILFQGVFISGIATGAVKG